MCKRTCCTWLLSSSSRVTLPWPSTRDSGSMATRRRFSGWAAVSSELLMRSLSVVMNQAVAELRLAPGQQVGQHFPDGIARGRATGNEIVDLHHLVQRVHLVQRQRQLGVVG